MTTTNDVVEQIAAGARLMAEHSAKMNPVPAKPIKKQQYTYRCPPPLYDAALAKAQARGDDLPEIIRRALDEYVDGEW